ncbi:MAG: hypothetical protein HQM07_02225 [Zetaproteobacteria bacterium]|nr:hypothetical protein [Zetaproteobacteria bacterium]
MKIWRTRLLLMVMFFLESSMAWAMDNDPMVPLFFQPVPHEKPLERMRPMVKKKVAKLQGVLLIKPSQEGGGHSLAWIDDQRYLLGDRLGQEWIARICLDRVELRGAKGVRILWLMPEMQREVKKMSVDALSNCQSRDGLGQPVVHP